MNFSEVFKQTGNNSTYSPDGLFLSSCTQNRLIIREAKSLQVYHVYTCVDVIEQVQWSGDSRFVLCVMLKRGLVQVWSLDQPEWTCKIDEGSAGLVAARWSSDSRHVLTTSDFQLRVTIWSLTNKSVSYIKYPKNCQQCMDFHSSGRYLALAERRDCKDFVSIFDCEKWALVKHFATDTDDLQGVKWSPREPLLCAWDSCLSYNILVYSIDGSLLAHYSAYELALGVKSVCWSPSGQFLAVGSFDETLRFLNNMTWQLTSEHKHHMVVDGIDVTVYAEVETKPGHLSDRPLDAHSPNVLQFLTHSKYEIAGKPFQVPSIKPDPNRANPKLGVGLLEFSFDGRFLASRNDNMPKALWIWELSALKLAAVLVQSSPIRQFQWDPTSCRLALCTANNRLYMWSEDGALSVRVPSDPNFTVERLKWHPSGRAVLLLSANKMVQCFLDTAAESGQPDGTD